MYGSISSRLVNLSFLPSIEYVFDDEAEAEVVAAAAAEEDAIFTVSRMI